MIHSKNIIIFPLPLHYVLLEIVKIIMMQSQKLEVAGLVKIGVLKSLTASLLTPDTDPRSGLDKNVSSC